jgi:hypothetical protein
MRNQPKQIAWKLEYDHSEMARRFAETEERRARRAGEEPRWTFPLVSKYFFEHNGVHVEYSNPYHLTTRVSLLVCVGIDSNLEPVWRLAWSASQRLQGTMGSIEKLDDFLKNNFKRIFSAGTPAELDAAVLDALPPNDTISF